MADVTDEVLSLAEEEMLVRVRHIAQALRRIEGEATLERLADSLRREGASLAPEQLGCGAVALLWNNIPLLLLAAKDGNGRVELNFPGVPG